MKNIRRLIIVLTFAVMAMIMMTTASFAETKIIVDGEDQSFQETSIKVWDWYTVKYITLNKEPESLTFESDEYDYLYPYEWDVDLESPFDVKEHCKWNPADYSETDLLDALEPLGLSEDDSYYVFFYDGWPDAYVFVVAVLGKQPPEAVISSYEQLSDDSVSVAFEGEDLDFIEAGAKASWFGASLETQEGESIPAKFTKEIIDGTHIKITYDISRSYEPELGPDKSTAKLTVSYKSAIEPKVFDVTLRASSYWSAYTEQPEKIAKDDKDWPEFVGYYKITSPEELAWFAGLVNGELQDVPQNNQAMAFLANDIVLNDTEGWEDWDESTPGLKFFDCTIGKAETSNYSGRKTVKFKGIFDGNYHSIQGLITYPDPTVPNYTYINDTALFPIVENAEIRNLGVEKSYISCYKTSYSGSRAAGIVCSAKQSVIENCWFKGHVKGNGNSASGAAGIAYVVNDGTIKNCFNAGIIEAATSYSELVAGICAGRGTFENCYNVGTVTSSYSESSALSIATGGGGYPVVYSNLISCYSTGTCALTTANGQTSKCFYLDGATEIANAERLTEEEFKNGTLLEGLGDAYCADDGNKNNGYPILLWQSDLFQAKRAAIKEVKYHLDSDNYGLSKKELEEALEMAIESLENASDLDALNGAKAAAIAALDQFKTDADIQSANAEEVAHLKEELAKINLKIDLQGAEVKVAEKSVIADGKAKTPAVTVTGKSGTVLAEGKDYEIVYSDNIKPGIAVVTVKGLDAVSDVSKETTFKILPKKLGAPKLKAAKKSLTVTWKKNADVTGYEVQYSLKKNFKGAKTAKIKKATTAKKAIKKLKSGKKYFVRVRAYKQADKEKLYGAWSAAKNAKVK